MWNVESVVVNTADHYVIIVMVIDVNVAIPNVDKPAIGIKSWLSKYNENSEIKSKIVNLHDGALKAVYKWRQSVVRQVRAIHLHPTLR